MFNVEDKPEFAHYGEWVSVSSSSPPRISVFSYEELEIFVGKLWVIYFVK